jgi:predicted nucleic acid-binding protein
VTDAVLDASVVIKWFHTKGEQHVTPAKAIRERFEAGELRILAPTLLWLELFNVAATRWGWTETKLVALARSLADLGFELEDPDIATAARWAARGLTAYDAAYVAVAEQAAVTLITDHEEIVRVAPKLATGLSALRAP